MKKIFSCSGTVNEGFVGQIAYSVCLEKPCKSLDIHFSFNKRVYPEITEEIVNKINSQIPDDCRPVGRDYTHDELVQIAKGAKTEIHVIAMMNDEFIGGLHRQLTDRHLIFSPELTSEGCIPQKLLHGNIRIVIVVFECIMDDTDYTVELSGEEV